MAVVPRIRKNGTVYYAANKQRGRLIWERVGPDKREAERRDAAMKKEIKAGHYQGKPTGAKTVGAFAETWLAARDTISAKDDRQRYRTHVLGRCAWFTMIKLEDVRGPDIVRLSRELKEPFVNKKGDTKTLAPRTHANIFKSLLGPMFAAARFAEVMLRNPFENLPDGTIDGTSTPRTPYDAATVIAMTTDERLAPHWRMMFSLLFYTGIRIGEGCGLTFADYDKGPKPLGCLTVSKQYNGRPLKGAKRVGDRHTRKVPVLPFLAKALDAWWAHGFEQVYCREPTPQDFIVPRHNGKNQSQHSTYEWFRTALKRLGIDNRTLHATRNTFISLARRAGARKEVLEIVTHRGEKGRGKDDRTEIDTYTHFDWDPLCEAVSFFQPTKTPRPKLRAVPSKAERARAVS